MSLCFSFEQHAPLLEPVLQKADMRARVDDLQQELSTLGTANSELESLTDKWAQKNVELTKQNEEMKVRFITFDVS